MVRLRNKTRRQFLYGTLLAVTAAIIWISQSGSSPQAIQAGPVDPSEAKKSVIAHDMLTSETLAKPVDTSPASKRESLAPTKVEAVSKIRTYRVVQGDTVQAIADRFDLLPSTILWSNQIEGDTLLQIDQELLIPATDGVIYTVADGDTLWEIATIHGSDVDQVIKANGDTSPENLQPGYLLLIPGGSPPRRAIQVASRSNTSDRPYPAATPTDSDLQSVARTWLWPLKGELTEQFGWRTHPVYGTRNYHEGIDIAAPEGTPVVAAGAGTVTLAEWYGGYGFTVRIDHGTGLASRYSHNSTLLVTVGDRVTAGQTIALAGNTGISTGSHLDFGFYQNGVPVDPLTMLP